MSGKNEGSNFNELFGDFATHAFSNSACSDDDRMCYHDSKIRKRL